MIKILNRPRYQIIINANPLETTWVTENTDRTRRQSETKQRAFRLAQSYAADRVNVEITEFAPTPIGWTARRWQVCNGEIVSIA